jgi:hypothetical protein
MPSLRRAGVGRRKIPVDLAEDIRRKLWVKAALEDISMQALVARVVEKAVKNVAVPSRANHRSRKEG